MRIAYSSQRVSARNALGNPKLATNVRISGSFRDLDKPILEEPMPPVRTADFVLFPKFGGRLDRLYFHFTNGKNGVGSIVSVNLGSDLDHFRDHNLAVLFNARDARTNSEGMTEFRPAQISVLRLAERLSPLDTRVIIENAAELGLVAQNPSPKNPDLRVYLVLPADTVSEEYYLRPVCRVVADAQSNLATNRLLADQNPTELLRMALAED